MSIYLSLARLALARPRLIPRMLAAGWAFRARRWYVRPPFLPLPPSSYMRWRMETAYGDRHAVPPQEDLARYLTWAARMRRGLDG